MSDWSDVCDAILADLTNNVPELAAAIVHDECAPWNPEELAAAAGERHVAAWPAPDAEQAVPLLTDGSYVMEQAYLVLVWEGAQEESGRVKLDRDATRAFLDLHNAVRARFNRQASLLLASSDLVRVAGTAFPDVLSTVRWFAVRVAVRRSQVLA